MPTGRPGDGGCHGPQVGGDRLERGRQFLDGDVSEVADRLGRLLPVGAGDLSLEVRERWPQVLEDSLRVLEGRNQDARPSGGGAEDTRQRQQGRSGLSEPHSQGREHAQAGTDHRDRTTNQGRHGTHLHGGRIQVPQEVVQVPADRLEHVAASEGLQLGRHPRHGRLTEAHVNVHPPGVSKAFKVEPGLTVVKVGIHGGLAVELAELVLDLLLLLLGELRVHLHVSLEGLNTLPQFRRGARIKLHADRYVSLQLVKAGLELAERPLIHCQASLDITCGTLHVPLQLSEVTWPRRQTDRRADIVELLLELLLLLLGEVRVNLHLGLDLLNLLPKSLQLSRLEVHLSLEADVRLCGLLAGLLK